MLLELSRDRPVHPVAAMSPVEVGTMTLPDPMRPEPRRVVLVTGLSGAGRSSILHVLEDLGYEAIDNPPLALMEELVTRGDRPVAVGIDTRSRGFTPADMLATLARLRQNGAVRPELVFAWAGESALLRRYTETRRRHPLALSGRVSEGIDAEKALMAPLRDAADLVLDTSALPIPTLRATIERRFGIAGEQAGMTVSLTSFAYSRGLPPDADLVFDVRFLRNPHYDPILRPGTGLDAPVAAFIADDPAYEPFLDKVTDLLTLLLPRFVREGKKYAGIAIGCTGGRHRSVHVAHRLAERVANAPAPEGAPEHFSWRVTLNHRELSHDVGGARDITGTRTDTAAADNPAYASQTRPARAQEA
jgi:RNase adapter protein RapZ